jgi:hypothetical protein
MTIIETIIVKMDELSFSPFQDTTRRGFGGSGVVQDLLLTDILGCFRANLFIYVLIYGLFVQNSRPTAVWNGHYIVGRLSTEVWRLLCTSIVSFCGRNMSQNCTHSNVLTKFLVLWALYTHFLILPPVRLVKEKFASL